MQKNNLLTVIRGALICLLGIVLVLTETFAQSRSSTAKGLWPIPDWQAATSTEKSGFSSEGLAAYGEWLKKKAGAKPYGTLIIRHGRIAFEQYGGGGTADSRWEIGSIRKSVYSSLLGMAIREGKLSLDTIVYDVWPEIYTLTGQEKDKSIRVRHLATATSGWKIEAQPDERWLYHNLAFSAGHAVIGRAYKLPEDKVAPLVETRIQNQIGAKSWKVYHYPEDWNKTPGPKLAIDSNLRDLARYGYLWLRKGEWNGRQIVPASYVEQASRNQVAHLGAHYGYLWFTNDGRALLPDAPPDAYFHTGSGRPNRKTVLFICPSLDLIALVGTDKEVYDIDSSSAVNEWVREILAAVKSRPNVANK